MTNKPKHNGCYDCKGADQEVLSSVMVKGSITGLALCDKCLEKRNVKKGEWNK